MILRCEGNGKGETSTPFVQDCCREGRNGSTEDKRGTTRS